MDDKARKDILAALRQGLAIPADGSSDNLHPVALLWRNADTKICDALLYCYDKYTNVQDQQESRNISDEGLVAVENCVKNMRRDKQKRRLDDRMQLILNRIRSSTSRDHINSTKLFILIAKRMARLEVQIADKAKDRAIKSEQKAKDELENFCQQLTSSSEREGNAIELRKRKLQNCIDRTKKAKSKHKSSRAAMKRTEFLIARAYGVGIKRNDAAITSNFSLSNSSNEKVRLSDTPETGMPGKDSGTSFMEFLLATNKLAVDLFEESEKITDFNYFVGGFIRSQLGDDFRRPNSLFDENEDQIQDVLNDTKIELLAQRACLLEVEHLNRKTSSFPKDYREPFGPSPTELARWGFQYRHSFLSAKVACASLMFARAKEEHLPYCRVLTSTFWIKNYAKDKLSDVTYIDPVVCPTQFCRDILNFYVDGDGARKQLASEYDSAWQWNASAGAYGTGPGSSEALLLGTFGDANFVRRVFVEVMTSTYKTTGEVALAGKFGAYFRSIYEPNCSRPFGSKFAASDQVNRIKKLHKDVRGLGNNVRPQNDCGIVPATHSIYFKSTWPSEIDFQDHCNWIDPDELPSEWTKRSSCEHALKPANVAPGAHLWLYGESFQGFVDEVIAQLARGTSSSSENEARFARFVYLVPFTGEPEKELSDWPKLPAMKRVLRYVGIAGPLRKYDLQGGLTAEFDVKGELYDPIVMRNKPNPNCLLFVPMIDHRGELV